MSKTERQRDGPSPASEGKRPAPQELRLLAHDLRNLLFPAMANAELLLHELRGLSPKQVRRLNTIVDRILKAEALVEDTLWLAQETGFRDPVNIHSVVNAVIGRVREDKQVHVRALYSTGAPPRVAGDESQLWRAVYNIVLNAAEASGKNGTVTVRVLKDSSTMVKIDIEDEGSGVPEEMRAKILSPFQTSKCGHAGLGLHLAYQVIRDHNGQLSVETGESGGALFTIKLPILLGSLFE